MRFKLQKNEVTDVNATSKTGLESREKIILVQCDLCNGQKSSGGNKYDCSSCNGSGLDPNKKCDDNKCKDGYKTYERPITKVDAINGAWFHGTEKITKICDSCRGTKKGICSNCKGKGVTVTEEIKCTKCKGSGWLSKIVNSR